MTGVAPARRLQGRAGWYAPGLDHPPSGHAPLTRPSPQPAPADAATALAPARRGAWPAVARPCSSAVGPPQRFSAIASKVAPELP